MIFRRKVYDKLLEWKNISAGASAALLEGARRIGKSTIVEEFANAPGCGSFCRRKNICANRLYKAKYSVSL